MNYYNEYNQEELKEIARKFQAGEFVTNAEIKTWNEYKKALQYAMKHKREWEQTCKDNGKEMSAPLKEICDDATQQYEWANTVPTFPLKDFCKYYLLTTDFYDAHNEIYITAMMAEKVVNNELTPVEEQLIRNLFNDSEYNRMVDTYRQVTTPINLREWSYHYNPGNEYNKFETAMDGTQLYDERTHYVYIQSECKQHRWGETYWVSIDCDNALYSLPVIKDFKNYDFKIGGFYKITCTNTIYYGGNKKKYVMEIEESTEEEFMVEGLRNFALRY